MFKIFEPNKIFSVNLKTTKYILFLFMIIEKSLENKIIADIMPIYLYNVYFHRPGGIQRTKGFI